MQTYQEKKFSEDAKKFRAWLATIPYGQYNTVINALVERCLVSKSTLNNWRFGNCRIPMSGKRDINSVSMEISGVEIFRIEIPEEPRSRRSRHTQIIPSRS